MNQVAYIGQLLFNCDHAAMQLHIYTHYSNTWHTQTSSYFSNKLEKNW